jgi:threonine/homoserine/homoserine lactone efflux protein
MDLWSWLSIAAVCGSGAVSPGPSLAVVLRNTVAGGRRQGVACALGHGIGVGIYALGAVVGLSAVLAAWPSISRLIAVAGGLFLLVLGIQALRGGDEGPTEPAAPTNGFREGFLTAFLNPKIAVFFLALLGAFVPDDSTSLTRVGVAALAMTIDAGWYTLVAVALAGSGAADWLKTQGRRIDMGMGLLFIGVALVVLWRA